MKKNDLHLLKKWQDLLYLQPWKIVLKRCTRDDMETTGEAEVTIHDTVQRAIIRILTPEEYSKNNKHYEDFPQDVERAIVHELLHIRLNQFVDVEDGTTESLLLENFIENIAELLVSLERMNSDGD